MVHVLAEGSLFAGKPSNGVTTSKQVLLGHGEVTMLASSRSIPGSVLLFSVMMSLSVTVSLASSASVVLKFDPDSHPKDKICSTVLQETADATWCARCRGDEIAAIGVEDGGALHCIPRGSINMKPATSWKCPAADQQHFWIWGEPDETALTHCAQVPEDERIVDHSTGVPGRSFVQHDKPGERHLCRGEVFATGPAGNWCTQCRLTDVPVKTDDNVLHCAPLAKITRAGSKPCQPGTVRVSVWSSDRVLVDGRCAPVPFNEKVIDYKGG
jgi:hypothetical protein